MDAPTCPRHPDVETRLRCSACDELICPGCASEAAVGYKCPDCKAAERGESPAGERDGSPLHRLGAGFRGIGGRAERPDVEGGADRPAGGSRQPGAEGRSDTSTNVRATVVGLVASVVGGLLLAPIFVGGMLFLISAGVIGWLVARSVYWASADRNSPYLRGAALTFAGFTAVVGLAQASGMTTVSELAYLALPAAVYGGWIVVRQR